MLTHLELIESLPTAAPPAAVHPLGSRASVLLTSVFGPYARDDEYGNRALNPMELYHNQVTRVQGPFSLRMFHRSWGLMLIQANIQAPCTLLDFPTLERFVKELRNNRYDVVGISGIIPNTLKVRKMCELVRCYQPDATIVVGGHIANLSRWGSPGYGWGWRVKTAGVANSTGSMHRPWSTDSNRTAFAFWGLQLSGWKSTHRRTSTQRSTTPLGTTRTFTSSCFTRRSPAPHCTTN